MNLLGEEAHPIGLEVQCAFEGRHRHVFEEVRAVGACRAVAVVGAEVVHRLAEPVRIVFRPVEEEVFEQVREAGPAWPLVARAHVVPEVDGDDRRRVILVDDQPKPVVQHVGLVRDLVGLPVEGRAGGRGWGCLLGEEAAARHEHKSGTEHRCQFTHVPWPSLK